jgi:anaerobic magnesium-protoporphyrin IX monomethyl ester cyclase
LRFDRKHTRSANRIRARDDHRGGVPAFTRARRRAVRSDARRRHAGSRRRSRACVPTIVVIYDDVFNWFTKMCLGACGRRRWDDRGGARGGCARRGVRSRRRGRAEVYLGAGADFVAVGEAEITLGELLARWTRRAIPRGARSALPEETISHTAPTARSDGRRPGLVFRDRASSAAPGPRALLKELGTLPIAAWDLVDVARYRAFWRERHGYFSLNVEHHARLPVQVQLVLEAGLRQHVSTRARPTTCRRDPPAARAVRARSPLVLRRHLRLKARWLMPFSERDGGAGCASVPCQTRADLMTAENVAALRRAGLRGDWLGVESGAQACSTRMDKG